ncbi:hypothetical protein Y047_5794 [Burkholderia pseudomallei MSHR3016]|nr:hypothetical protein X948_4583 [Burkholderia pseudomallei MSHR5608]KGW37844.1 hypothetical protein Y047_5794 [Burkholderia pseudomallei MSHR3016]
MRASGVQPAASIDFIFAAYSSDKSHTQIGVLWFFYSYSSPN